MVSPSCTVAGPVTVHHRPKAMQAHIAALLIVDGARIDDEATVRGTLFDRIALEPGAARKLAQPIAHVLCFTGERYGDHLRLSTELHVFVLLQEWCEARENSGSASAAALTASIERSCSAISPPAGQQANAFSTSSGIRPNSSSIWHCGGMPIALAMAL